MSAPGGRSILRAAQRATTSIPILAFTDDMVGQGFVNSLSEPASERVRLIQDHQCATLIQESIRPDSIVA
jgi:hypothetical protein